MLIQHTVCTHTFILLCSKSAYLSAENSALTTFRCLPIRYCTPCPKTLDLAQTHSIKPLTWPRAGQYSLDHVLTSAHRTNPGWVFNSSISCMHTACLYSIQYACIHLFYYVAKVPILVLKTQPLTFLGSYSLSQKPLIQPKSRVPSSGLTQGQKM